MSRAWTESFVLSRIRAVLRRLSMQMPVIRMVKLANRRKYTGPRRQQKFEYQCAVCHQWFPEKEIQVDHIVPAGSMRTFEDVGPFARRLLFCSISDMQVLCHQHHREKSNAENAARRAAKKAAKIL